MTTDYENDLRFAVPEIARQMNISPSHIREVVCGVLLRAPDRDNWSDSNILDEVRRHLAECPLPKVYAIAEALYASMPLGQMKRQFEGRLNEFFAERDAGLEMRSGKIVERPALRTGRTQ